MSNAADLLRYIPRQEIVDLVDLVIGDMREYVGQIGVQVDAVELVQVPINPYIAAARSPPLSEPANKKSDEFVVASTRRAVKLLREKGVEGYVLFESDPTPYELTPDADFVYPAVIH